jgi:hypothetical protein
MSIKRSLGIMKIILGSENRAAHGIVAMQEIIPHETSAN